jgi:DNA processing protein
VHACDACLRRPWLLERLSAHLDRHRSRVIELSGLDDLSLIAAIGGSARSTIEADYRRLGAAQARSARQFARRRGISLVCACDPEYPDRLAELPAAPRVLHVVGCAERFRSICDADPVAIVGTRNATPEGAGAAESFARSLSAAKMTVVSGMANGIDANAHAGALAAGGDTIAVMPGSADTAYPSNAYRLHQRILVAGVAVSELPPGAATRRWTFVARNRIIAGLAVLTVVIEAPDRSGALVTAAVASSLRRPVGAVPGTIANRQAAGTNELIARGALMIRSPQEVLDAVYGAGVRKASADRRPRPTAVQRQILDAIAGGHETAGALLRHGIVGLDGVAELAALESAGWLRRAPGGRLGVVP